MTEPNDDEAHLMPPRIAAARLLESIDRGASGILHVHGIDLRPALEQALFAGLRAADAEHERGAFPMAGSALRIARAWALGLIGFRQPVRVQLVALLQVPIHASLFAPIGEELKGMGISRQLRVSAGGGGRGSWADVSVRRSLHPAWVPRLVAHGTRVARARLATAEWDAIVPRARARMLERIVRQSLPRVALMSAQLDSVLRRARPSVLVSFNEVGPWGRIGPAVAQPLGIRTVDLPHAEAADADAAFGLAYDAMAVYSQPAAATLAAAGIEPQRIHVVGPLRFDGLVRALDVEKRDGPNLTGAQEAKKVIYASQPVVPRIADLGPGAKASALRAALAACGVVSPAELVVLPHPTESLGDLRAIVDALEPPSGVSVRIATGQDLHAALLEAWLLITVSSQSVFDAAVAGVPSICISLGGGDPPVTYAEEGFALRATSAHGLKELARELRSDNRRSSVIAEARAAVERRFGALDGMASRRAADVIRRLVADGRPGASGGHP